jgi:hypothetical protein
MKISKAKKDKSQQNKAKHSKTKLASTVVSFGSIETPKVAVALFFKTTKTSSLFVSDSVKTSLGFSFCSFYMNKIHRTPYHVGMGGGVSDCFMFKVVSSVQPKLRNLLFRFFE